MRWVAKYELRLLGAMLLSICHVPEAAAQQQFRCAVGLADRYTLSGSGNEIYTLQLSDEIGIFEREGKDKNGILGSGNSPKNIFSSKADPRGLKLTIYYSNGIGQLLLKKSGALTGVTKTFDEDFIQLIIGQCVPQ